MKRAKQRKRRLTLQVALDRLAKTGGVLCLVMPARSKAELRRAAECGIAFA